MYVSIYPAKDDPRLALLFAALISLVVGFLESHQSCSLGHNISCVYDEEYHPISLQQYSTISIYRPAKHCGCDYRRQLRMGQSLNRPLCYNHFPKEVRRELLRTVYRLRLK